MLKEGMNAPDFCLFDQHGNKISLSQFAGKKVVLYFYSKDNSLGCTRQAVGFAQLHKDISSYGAVIVGISRDSVESHSRFADKYDLPFVLLSDPELEAIRAYDVWQEKKKYGKTSMGVVRSTYIIDENGVIETVMEDVKGITNPFEVLEALKAK